MLTVLSPSKTIDFRSIVSVTDTSLPIFSPKADALIEQLKLFTPEQIVEREQVSLKIAFATREYIHTYKPEQPIGKPAVFAYNGNVYDKLQAQTFSPAQQRFLQQHLRIFSALYGVLRPMDLIQPYRLDMTSKLIEGLYAIWKDMVSREIATLLADDDYVLINLASAEYFKLLDSKILPAQTHIITPVFKQVRNGRYMVSSLYAKQARGLMTRFLIENQITDPEHLQAFSEDGYFFSPELSNTTEWTFIR
jgi:hypothetical protein